jgi:hypothetical protein
MVVGLGVAASADVGSRLVQAGRSGACGGRGSASCASVSRARLGERGRSLGARRLQAQGRAGRERLLGAREREREAREERERDRGERRRSTGGGGCCLKKPRASAA